MIQLMQLYRCQNHGAQFYVQHTVNTTQGMLAALRDTLGSVLDAAAVACSRSGSPIGMRCGAATGSG